MILSGIYATIPIEGNDTITGGAGDDRIDGGCADDTAGFAAGINYCDIVTELVGDGAEFTVRAGRVPMPRTSARIP